MGGDLEQMSERSRYFEEEKPVRSDRAMLGVFEKQQGGQKGGAAQMTTMKETSVRSQGGECMMFSSGGHDSGFPSG